MPKIRPTDMHNQILYCHNCGRATEHYEHVRLNGWVVDMCTICETNHDHGEL